MVCFDCLHCTLLNVSISEPDFSRLISNELSSKQYISAVMLTIPLIIKKDCIFLLKML